MAKLHVCDTNPERCAEKPQPGKPILTSNVLFQTLIVDTLDGAVSIQKFAHTSQNRNAAGNPSSFAKCLPHSPCWGRQVP